MPIPEPRPFRVAVPDEVLADLRRRLDRPADLVEPAEAGWRYGANLAYMRRLVDYWRSGFDWRRAEAALNRFPQHKVGLPLADGHLLELHFIHERGSGDHPLPRS